MSFYVEYEYLRLPKMNTPQAVITSKKKKKVKNGGTQKNKNFQNQIPITI